MQNKQLHLLLLLLAAALVGNVDGDGLLRRRRRVVLLLRDDVVQALLLLLRRLLLVLRHWDQHAGLCLGVVGLSGQRDDVGRPRALQDDGGRGRRALLLRLQWLQLLLVLLLLCGVAHDDDLLGLRLGHCLVGLGPDWLRRKCGGRCRGGLMMHLAYDMSEGFICKGESKFTPEIQTC